MWVKDLAFGNQSAINSQITARGTRNALRRSFPFHFFSLPDRQFPEHSLALARKEGKGVSFFSFFSS
jgi:hypothetical protein